MPIQYLRSTQELQSYTACEALVVYFTATWCGPCQAIAPLMEQLYNQYTTVEIVKVDLDAHRDVASRYQITAVPTFVYLHRGKEVDRVRGASTQGIHESLKKLSALAPNGKRKTSNGDSSAPKSHAALNRFIPKGFSLLNNSVMFGDFEALNTANDLETVKSLVKLDTEATISSDADSQLLVHIPLSNICKVSSVLIKSTSTTAQRPTLCKIWINRNSIITFEDATSLTALHEEKIIEYDADGWYEIKLKYVKFQKVTSIDLFFDGEDEDEQTVLDKIALVGIDGESKTQGTLDRSEE